MGGEIVFGAGSITLSIPTLTPRGVKVASFVDLLSGISIIGRNVEVPLRDPVTGETLLRLQGKLKEELQGNNAGDAATGQFESLTLQTEERGEDLSADDPLVGRLGVALNASLDRLPENVNVQVTIKKKLTNQDRTQVELEARDGAKIVANEAGTVTVQTTNLETEDIGEVNITMKVSAEWVHEFGRRNVQIAHVGKDGQVELLDTECTGPDENNEYACVGMSTRGFSEFSLLALADVPAQFVAENLLVTPTAVDPGDAVTITVDIVNKGSRFGSFSAILKIQRPGSANFEPIAVQEITLGGLEQGTVRFFVQREEQGRYDVEIEGLSGAFDVFKKLDPANLSFSNLAITPEEATPGEPVKISMFAGNSGEQDGRTDIEFRINDVLTELRALSVPASGRVEVIFEFVPPAEGTYRVKLIDPEELVSPLTGDITAVIPLAPAEFLFANINVSPLEMDPKDPVTVTFQLTNIGEQPGTRPVVLLLNEEPVASQDVTVDELSAVTVTFEIEAPEEAGDYTVRIEDLRGAFRVREVEVEVPEPRIESISVEPLLVDVGGLVVSPDDFAG